MHFVGSLEIKGFKTLGNRRAAILRETRNAYYRAFTYAIGAMLLEIGEQIPYLTGATRGAVQEVLAGIDARIAQYGGVRTYMHKLRMATTLRKMSKGVKPRHSSNLYSVLYTRTYRGGRKIKSRGDWRDYLMEQGQNEDSERESGHGEFRSIGTASYGRLAFHFRLAVEHWTRYDLDGVPGKPRKGPWEVIDSAVPVYREAMSSLTKEVASRVLQDFATDPDAILRRLQSWQPHELPY
jgi:hypothetical protein